MRIVPIERTLVLPWEIMCKDDARQLFQGLADYGISFHPDESALDYVDREGNTTLTPEQAAKVDKLVGQAFECAEKQAFDVYEIGLEVLDATMSRLNNPDYNGGMMSYQRACDDAMEDLSNGVTHHIPFAPEVVGDGLNGAYVKIWVFVPRGVRDRYA